MSGPPKWSDLRDTMMVRPGAAEAVAVPKLEHAEDVRVSTLRDYPEALGARLELVALTISARRVPVCAARYSAG